MHKRHASLRGEGLHYCPLHPCRLENLFSPVPGAHLGVPPCQGGLFLIPWPSATVSKRTCMPAAASVCRAPRKGYKLGVSADIEHNMPGLIVAWSPFMLTAHTFCPSCSELELPSGATASSCRGCSRGCSKKDLYRQCTRAGVLHWHHCCRAVFGTRPEARCVPMLKEEHDLPVEPHADRPQQLGLVVTGSYTPTSGKLV